MLFTLVNVGFAQWTLDGVEGLLPNTIKTHVVKIVIMRSINPDVNNNIGRA